MGRLAATWVGGIFVLLGAVTDAVGIVRYVIFRRDMLSDQPTPTSDRLVVLVAVGVTVLGALLGVLVIVRMF